MRKNLGKLMTMMLAFVVWGMGWPSTGSADASAEDPRVEWSAEFRGGSGLYDYSAGEAVTATSDGNYVVVGRTYSKLTDGPIAYVLKLNPQGEVLWEREIAYIDSYGYMPNKLSEVIETSDGHILIGGDVREGGNEWRPRNVPYIAKLTQDGDVLWQKAYLDMPFYFQSADVIAETKEGNYVITGITFRTSGEVPAYLLKINADGEELWSRTYKIGYMQNFDHVVVTPDNGVIVSGRKMYGSEGPETPILLKVNSTGEIVWQKNQENDPIDAILAAADGSYVLTRHDPDTHSYYLQTLSGSGNLLETKKVGVLPGEGNRNIRRFQTYDQGYAFITELRTSYDRAKYQLVILNANGDAIKSFLFGSGGLNSVGKGIVTSDGGFLLTGRVVTKGSNMEVIKLASPGSPTEPVLTGIAFQPDRMELSVGQTASSVVNAVYSDASVTDVTYSASFESADPSIALVDGTGKVTAVSPGSTIVTASYEGMQASLTVEVKEGAPGFGRFYLDSEEYSVSVGAELDIAAHFADEDGRILLVTKDTVFETADPAIATIDKDGNIRGISPGITWITATYHGHSFRAPVWVVRPYSG
ncbi:hypothetical protein J25TS5_02280 [Paenibacillus faecis]|uniref:Ig-like domain-containing protein n=1 Tax=Paenibacillus faecis TaxID=862114 RepID=UPI001B2A557B|nr:Ig-like domain-containing protein [Paenibacillus faecis]GIO83296.1 hypothetical protein J25TS5_02280 [Paenibacillus faecis]